ncbi:hypothetical protein [Microbacterium sp. NPDC055599]
MTAYDTDGRQGAVDFVLQWYDGRRAALEVTMVTEPASIAWQSMAMKDGWRWPASTGWEFRPAEANFPYKFVRSVAVRAAALCDALGVDDLDLINSSILAADAELSIFLAEGYGTLRRTNLSPGITVYPVTRTEFLDREPSDFARVIESWRDHAHIGPHIDKLIRAEGISERHLFLVPTDDVLPSRFFTDDFEPPRSRPAGYDAIDVLWIWSNYWHRYLKLQGESSAWIRFPPRDKSGSQSDAGG